MSGYVRGASLPARERSLRGQLDAALARVEDLERQLAAVLRVRVDEDDARHRERVGAGLHPVPAWLGEQRLREATDELEEWAARRRAARDRGGRPVGVAR